jgi:hypothetical protein
LPAGTPSCSPTAADRESGLGTGGLRPTASGGRFAVVAVRCGVGS